MLSVKEDGPESEGNQRPNKQEVRRDGQGATLPMHHEPTYGAGVEEEGDCPANHGVRLLGSIRRSVFSNGQKNGCQCYRWRGAEQAGKTLGLKKISYDRKS